jgi:hypothetical protein
VIQSAGAAIAHPRVIANLLRAEGYTDAAKTPGQTTQEALAHFRIACAARIG